MKPTKQSISVAVALLASATLHVKAQTNITIQSPRFAEDRTATIRWNSVTGGVYQVEAVDSLSDDSGQGLQWVIRETDCPSKGTNAVWMDVGDTRWIPRILPPRFQNQRFYRVQKVGQATLPAPSVSVQLSQSNVPLPSGTNAIGDFLDINVGVTISDTNSQISNVGVYVDGQRLYSVPSETFTVSINTTEWPNGIHEIYAIATTIDGGETLPDNDSQTATNAANLGIGVSASQFEVFSNYISQFFVAVPYFDPGAGQIQEIVATFPEDSCWRLTVLDYQDTPVIQFTNQSSLLYAAWDGNDAFGNPLPYGFYDYYIEARPSRFGCLDGMGAMAAVLPSSAGLSRTATSATDTTSAATTTTQTPNPMRFPRGMSGVKETISIPSLNPTPPVAEMNAAQMAVLNFEPTITYEVSDDGVTNKFINGVPANLYPPDYIEVLDRIRNGASMVLDVESEVGTVDEPLDAQSSNFGDGVYTTRYPNRFPGNMFMGFAGTVGIGFQGHHPSSPSFSLPSGGVISPSHPPYGNLETIASLANGFSINMGLGGWRTAFYLGNDNLWATNIIPTDGVGLGHSKFSTGCDFGFLAGHMTATANTDPNYGCTHSYYPLYNTHVTTGAYNWLALPRMDFGNGASPLKWMALYGCNSLRQQDFNDMWTKFLVPMPPNLRLILGSEDGVFIHPAFGWRFAANLHGWTNQGNPMTIVQAWYDAGNYTCQQMAKSWRWRFRIGTRVMTAAYRDNTQGGSWRTISDSIWSYSGDISYDWFDQSIDHSQVYP